MNTHPIFLLLFESVLPHLGLAMLQAFVSTATIQFGRQSDTKDLAHYLSPPRCLMNLIHAPREVFKDWGLEEGLDHERAQCTGKVAVGEVMARGMEYWPEKEPQGLGLPVGRGQEPGAPAPSPRVQ